MLLAGLPALALLVSCLDEPTVRLTFINETEAELCHHVSPENVVRDDLCADIDADGTTVWRPECGAAGKQPLPVLLTVRHTEHVIHSATATCDEWTASGGEILIQQRGGEFIVTDNLSKATPTP
jgi:hypothetical protein